MSSIDINCANCRHVLKGKIEVPCRSCKSHCNFEPAIDVKDKINPAHYKDQCSLECIQVMTIMFGESGVHAFCVCNAFKYMWRFRNKNGVEDLKKAQWYIDYAKNIDPDLGNLKEMQNFLDQLKGGVK